MREIIFRGKRQDTEKWVEGYYMCLHTTNNEGSLHFIVDKHGEYHRIDPDTVCQYIGLQDKNGKKIFENDIVTNAAFCLANESYGVIQWRDDEAMFLVDADYCYYQFDNIYDPKLEVIGNVFDNPELLESVKK